MDLRGLYVAHGGAFDVAVAASFGVSEKQVRRRVADGDWQRLLPGMFGPAGVGFEGRCWAALNYAGPDAALSHLTAAEWLDLPLPRDPRLFISVGNGRTVAPQPGLKVVQRPYLGSDDVQLVNGMRCMRIENTTIDCGVLLGPREALASLPKVVGVGRTTPARLLDTALRTGQHFRHRWLRELLEDMAGGARALPEVELLRVVRRFGLPAPQGQLRWVTLDGESRYTDQHWDEYAVLAETDGRTTHVERWELDLIRQNEMGLVFPDAVLQRFTLATLRRDRGAYVAGQLDRLFRRPGIRPLPPHAPCQFPAA